MSMQPHRTFKDGDKYYAYVYFSNGNWGWVGPYSSRSAARRKSLSGDTLPVAFKQTE